MTIPALENNQWFLHEHNLRTQLFFDFGKDPAVPTDIKWFQMDMKSQGDSPVEKIEQQQAQMEQVKLGILKVEKAPAPVVPQVPTVKPAQPITLNVPKKVGPNEPCPCGSGIKHKKCHGRGMGRV